MADSDDTTNLPEITRRKLLSVAGVLLTAALKEKARVSDPVVSYFSQEGNGDAAVNVWNRWDAIHVRRQGLCRQQQELERRLLHAVGFPLVELQVPGRDRLVCVHTSREIDIVLSGAEMTSARRRAQIELAAHQKAWNEYSEQLGYEQAFEAELDLQETELALAGELLATPAQSIAGVIAKLHCLIEMEDAELVQDDNPSSPLQMILADLVKIDGKKLL